MSHLKPLYQHSLALLTDLYQLTMASAYFRTGTAAKEAVFHLYSRHNPFQSGFSIACGLGDAIEYLEQFSFDVDDIRYLASLKGNDERPLFEQDFLNHISQLRFSCDIDAIPEGTAVFPNEPLVRITGPIMQCQLLETALLNIINFQTLIATKAARVCLAAQGDPVLEFGLRRAQGIDGSLAASRAAYIGGCAATSNLLAGKLLGIPVKGTHAHSWVMSFDDEQEAFEAYAQSMPNNCVFLVDTYDTLEGVRRAAMVGRKLKEQGHRMIGIRLDSGDLAYLSIEARKILDLAGLTDAIILASNDLDEELIQSLKLQGATIAMWGVGTNLVTGGDQPALGGVYKLSAIRDNPESDWIYKIKLSEQLAKASTPGILQVRRYKNPTGELVADAIYNLVDGIHEHATIVDPADNTRRKVIPSGTAWEDLLVPIFRKGKKIYQTPDLNEIRSRTTQQLASLAPAIKRFAHPHQYPAGLELGLSQMRMDLLLKSKGVA